MDRKQLALLVALVTVALRAGAWCTAPETKVCTAFFESDKVFYGKVVGVRPEGDNGFDNPEWLRYTIEVETPLKGKVGRVEVVETENASARWTADVGEHRVVFARNGKTWNLCSPIDDELHVKATMAAIQALSKIKNATVEGEVLDAAPGSKLVIAGATRSYEARVDDHGRFLVAVEPGHYRIASQGLKPTIPYSREDIGGFDLLPGQCAQFQLSNVSVR